MCFTATSSNPRCILLPAVFEGIGPTREQLEQFPERTFISTRYFASFTSFLCTYNLIQDHQKGKVCLEEELQVLKAKLIILLYFFFPTYLLVTSLELCPNKTLKIKFHERNLSRRHVFFWGWAATPINKLPVRSPHLS